MERRPFFALDTCNSVGLDKVPVNGLMLNKQTGGLFNLNNKTGLLGATKLKDFVGKFFAYEPNDFVDTCVLTEPINGQVCVFIYPGSYWSQRFIDFTGEVNNRNPNLSETYLLVGTSKYYAPSLFWNIEIWNGSSWGGVFAIDNDAGGYLTLNSDILPNYGIIANMASNKTLPFNGI